MLLLLLDYWWIFQVIEGDTGCNWETECVSMGRRCQCHSMWVCVERGSKRLWHVGGWITGRQPQPLQCPACSVHTVSLWYDIHNGIAWVRLFSWFYVGMHMSVVLCVNSSSKFSRSAWCPLLILSQNGCCQAEKLPSGALMGLNGKLIHNRFMDWLSVM